MKSPNERLPSRRPPKPALPSPDEMLRMVEEYADDLREIIKQLQGRVH
jgi:hypothetical protein